MRQWRRGVGVRHSPTSKLFFWIISRLAVSSLWRYSLDTRIILTFTQKIIYITLPQKNSWQSVQYGVLAPWHHWLLTEAQLYSIQYFVLPGHIKKRASIWVNKWKLIIHYSIWELCLSYGLVTTVYQQWESDLTVFLIEETCFNLLPIEVLRAL